MFNRLGMVTAGATILLAACSGSRAPTTSVSPARSCVVGPAPTSQIDSALIVVTSTIDVTGLEHPTSWGERFVAGLTVDTVRFDCAGQPLGAPPYRVGLGRRQGLSLEPVGAGPRLIVRSATEVDARDLIDTGVDLLLTNNQALATYAATRADVSSIALPWDQTWVLVTPGQSGLASSFAPTFRTELARDVVRGDARPAEGPFWWTDRTTCGTVVNPIAAPTLQNTRIVYSRDEQAGRALAERIVALVGAGSTATGLAPNALASALRSGSDLGYIVPLRRLTRDRCRDVADLLTAAPWLSQQGEVTPLVDTRLRAVFKRDRLNLLFARDSSLTLAPGRQ